MANNDMHDDRPHLPGSGPQSAPPSARNVIFLLIGIALLVYVFAGRLGQGAAPTRDIATSEFVAAVEDDRVQSVTYHLKNHELTGKYLPRSSQGSKPGSAVDFRSTFVGEDSLYELMAGKPDVVFKVDASTDDMLELLVGSVLPTVLIIGAFMFFMNQFAAQQGRQMNFGKTQARTNDAERPKVKFADVAGIDEAVEEVQEVKDFLANPDRYRRMGAKIPKGVLLVGPPGTGKTLLAKAVAGEAGVPFFSISGSDFVEMFVGVGASRVRDLFAQAKAEAPAIIFIDEIDAVGRQRGAGLGGSHDEREQTLNQMLVEMDGFEDNQAVILIAATNRPDILDPALLRPGRFDRQITVDRPDVKGRETILRVHSEGKPLAADVDLEATAKMTPGFTGADLANLMNEAALLAARKRLDVIGNEEVQEAFERQLAGPERKSRVMSEEERRTTAYHESGHALVGHVLKDADPVHKITIVSRGRALGYTMSLPEDDRFLDTRSRMLDQIAVLMGGRTAEEIFCNDITTGASNDLERATKLAREMVTRYGMSEALGAQVYGQAEHEVFLGRDYANRSDMSPETTKRIDDEVERIMRSAHERAREILEAHRAQMDTMAAVLLREETVEGELLDALLNDTWDAYVAQHPERALNAAGAAEAGTRRTRCAHRAHVGPAPHDRRAGGSRGARLCRGPDGPGGGGAGGGRTIGFVAQSESVGGPSDGRPSAVFALSPCGGAFMRGSGVTFPRK